MGATVDSASFAQDETSAQWTHSSPRWKKCMRRRVTARLDHFKCRIQEGIRAQNFPGTICLLIPLKSNELAKGSVHLDETAPRDDFGLYASKDLDFSWTCCPFGCL